MICLGTQVVNCYWKHASGVRAAAACQPGQGAPHPGARVQYHGEARLRSSCPGLCASDDPDSTGSASMKQGRSTQSGGHTGDAAGASFLAAEVCSWAVLRRCAAGGDPAANGVRGTRALGDCNPVDRRVRRPARAGTVGLHHLTLTSEQRRGSWLCYIDGPHFSNERFAAVRQAGHRPRGDQGGGAAAATARPGGLRRAEANLEWWQHRQ